MNEPYDREMRWRGWIRTQERVAILRLLLKLGHRDLAQHIALLEHHRFVPLEQDFGSNIETALQTILDEARNVVEPEKISNGTPELLTCYACGTTLGVKGLP